MKGVQLPKHLSSGFEELATDNETIQAKYDAFCRSIHQEHKALALRAKALWAQTVNDMGLQGNWRYTEGKIYPMDEAAAK